MMIANTLFNNEENNKSFSSLLKFVSLTPRGFGLCQSPPQAWQLIKRYFINSELSGFIHFIDMANPPLNTLELQKWILADSDSWESNKKIYFIYNIESCIDLLGSDKKSYFESLNLIRDFFGQFNALFIFFMTEYSVKSLVNYAFDFYDWMRSVFNFVPEESGFILQESPMIMESELDKYSNPEEKIEYLEEYRTSITNKGEKYSILNDLGFLYRQVGNYDKTLKLFYAALNLVEKDDVTSLAGSYNNLSIIYKDRGELKKALEFQEKALEIRERVPGKNYQDLAKSYNNLSLIYKAGGELDKARDFQLKALEIREKVLGKNHPDLVLPFNNLSLIYKAGGELEKALEFQLKALEINEKVLGKDHLDLAPSYNTLSGIYFDTKDYKNAKEYAEKAVAIMEKNFPDGHPNLEVMKENLEAIKEFSS
ncbi:MAG: tetratricopeptide repeat protein [bacterium]|nr:tetratricopeptide repeat protein [bacterium]